jgi:TPP-dependent indolepyruvate ferredoxin oxidoreductase alpha subunit
LAEVKNVNEYRIKQLILSSDNYLTIGVSEDGQSIVMPKKGMYDYSEIKNAIKKLLKGISLTPTEIQNSKGKS